MRRRVDYGNECLLYCYIVMLMEQNEELQGVVTAVELPTVDMIEVPASNGMS